MNPVGVETNGGRRVRGGERKSRKKNRGRVNARTVPVVAAAAMVLFACPLA